MKQIHIIIIGYIPHFSFNHNFVINGFIFLSLLTTSSNFIMMTSNNITVPNPFEKKPKYVEVLEQIVTRDLLQPGEYTEVPLNVVSEKFSDTLIDYFALKDNLKPNYIGKISIIRQEEYLPIHAFEANLDAGIDVVLIDTMHTKENKHDQLILVHTGITVFIIRDNTTDFYQLLIAPQRVVGNIWKYFMAKNKLQNYEDYIVFKDIGLLYFIWSKDIRWKIQGVRESNPFFETTPPKVRPNALSFDDYIHEIMKRLSKKEWTQDTIDVQYENISKNVTIYYIVDDAKYGWFFIPQSEYVELLKAFIRGHYRRIMIG